MIAAVCCFTPIQVVLFGAIGLAGWVAGVDSVLIAALVGFAALTVYALIRKSRAAAERAEWW